MISRLSSRGWQVVLYMFEQTLWKILIKIYVSCCLHVDLCIQENISEDYLQSFCL